MFYLLASQQTPTSRRQLSLTSSPLPASVEYLNNFMESMECMLINYY